MSRRAHLKHPQDNFRVLERTTATNSYGEETEAYAPGLTFVGWVQPITREALEAAGLEGERVDHLVFSAVPVSLSRSARLEVRGQPCEVLRVLEWPEHSEIYTRRP